MISLVLILFSVKTYTKSRVESIGVIAKVEEKNLQTSEIQELREKIISANQAILKLNLFYRSRINLVETIENISKILPAGIKLTTLSWQKKNSQIAVSGLALTREDLFELKKNLEEKFTEIYFPPQNWIEPANINFQATFKLKK